jgi:hypothetical protein
MSNPSFASLNASLLARKGEAKPSGEPRFGSMPWQPSVKPPAKILAPIPNIAAADAVSPAPPHVPPPPTVIGADPANVKVRLQDTPVWPAKKPTHAPDNDGTGWVASKPQPPLENQTVAYKTTIRLTHAQARAVKLAALVLDRPQQEILTAGLLDRLEAMACQDLAKCSCFQAVLEGLKTPPLA